MPYAYIVRCGDGSLYSGYAMDVEKRIAAHNSGKGAKYTRSRLPVELVYSEELPSKSEAMRREAQLKKMTKAEKEQMLYMKRSLHLVKCE